MRVREPSSMLGPVDTNERVRVVVELQPVADTIRGQIVVEDAPAIDFFGWLELIDRLQRAASAATPGPAEDPNRVGPG
jgi:hypothetical protein